ncbi:MAG TPA: hypothetical protein VGO81_19410 [Solirubrobacteraceae bacterium]|nr:hypothetical protein [Solirubrobacteraceae bacterium]
MSAECCHDRDISACAWLATVEDDRGQAVYATVLPSGVSNTSLTVIAHNNGSEVDGIVHVAVFC